MKRKGNRKENLRKMWTARSLKSKLRQQVGARADAPSDNGNFSGTLPSVSPSNQEVPFVSALFGNEAKVVASKRKLSYTYEYLFPVTDEDNDKNEYMFVHKGNMLEWVRSFARCKCGKKMCVKEKGVDGMAFTFAAVCTDCNNENTFCTSEGGRLKGGYDVHKKLVKSTLENGNGFVGARSLFAKFNMPPLSETSYYRLANQIQKDGIEKLEKIMEKTRKMVHEILKTRDGNEEEVKNLKVSCDGSWSKRGFTSNYGFTSVIEMTTGFCVDFVVTSKYCRICETTDNMDSVPNHECTRNYEGSSPSMETEGWRQLWSRSVEKCKFRYVEVVSDGDSKGYSAVKALDPYDGIEIKKLECCNHVEKRLSGALLSLSRNQKLGGKGEGNLTKAKILRLAHYFSKSINQQTTVADMKRSIFATLRHCQSTDKKPQHSTCPEGENSWCFYKRAIANNQPIPSHKTKMSTYLSESVVAKIMPAYIRLSSNELLEKCQGDTQNSNECLHSVIWNELPKTKFFHLTRILYGVYRAVVKFNHGYSAPDKATCDLTKVGKKVFEFSNRKRVSNAERRESKKEKAKVRRILKVQEEERKISEEGDTYGPGIAPL